MNNLTRIIQTRSRTALKNDENISSVVPNPVHVVKPSKVQLVNKRVPLVARNTNTGPLVNVTTIDIKPRNVDLSKPSRQTSKKPTTIIKDSATVASIEQNQVFVGPKTRRSRSKPESQIVGSLVSTQSICSNTRSSSSTSSSSTGLSALGLLVSMPISSSHQQDSFREEKMILDPMSTTDDSIHMDETPSDLLYEDIDSQDRDDPQAVAEYAEEIYRWLREKEIREHVKFDYMTRQADLVEKFRTILIDWLIEVHYKFQLRSETLFLTVALIDRYLNVMPVPRTQLQLVGVTAMLIASKYEEIYPPECADLTFITKEAYTKEELLSCEESMLNALHFNLSFPTSFHFLKRFVKASRTETAKFYSLCKFLLEATLLNLNMSIWRPSQLAAAVVYLARASLGYSDPLWTSTLRHYTQYNEEEIRPIARKLCSFIATLHESETCSVVKKYKTTKFHQAALITLATV